MTELVYSQPQGLYSFPYTPHYSFLLLINVLPILYNSSSLIFVDSPFPLYILVMSSLIKLTSFT